jgi:glycosyltransferase involved in cell wall biosynthesis
MAASPASEGVARKPIPAHAPPGVPAGLHVVIVTTSFPRNADDFAGHFVARLAEALCLRGHTIEVVAPHAAGLPDREQWPVPAAPNQCVWVSRFRYAPEALELVAYGDGIPSNIRRHPLAVLALPGFVLALRRAAMRASRDADVVHAQWAPTAAIIDSHKLGAPMVVTLHGSDVALAARGGFWRRILRRGLEPPTVAVIAVSHEMAQQLSTIVPTTALLTLSVITTGIEPSLLARPVPERVKRAPVTVAFVGRLLEGKGVIDLARAFATLPKRTRLVVAGDGPAREGFAALLAELGVKAERVEFLGALDREAALDVMARADIIAVPSHKEGAGLVALEASAMGKCVVGSRTGIMPDVLALEQLFDPLDVAGLTERLASLARDSRKRDRLGHEARQRVAAAFTWDVLAEQVEVVYLRAALGVEAGEELPEAAHALRPKGALPVPDRGDAS